MFIKEDTLILLLWLITLNTCIDLKEECPQDGLMFCRESSFCVWLEVLWFDTCSSLPSQLWYWQYLILIYGTIPSLGSAGCICCNDYLPWFVRSHKTWLEGEVLRFQGLTIGEGSIYCGPTYLWVRVFGCIDNVCTCQIRRNIFQYVYSSSLSNKYKLQLVVRAPLCNCI